MVDFRVITLIENTEVIQNWIEDHEGRPYKIGGSALIVKIGL